MTELAGKTIALSSGGTGGHMFPLTAVAKALTVRGASVHIITDARGAPYARNIDGVICHKILAGGIAGRGLSARMGATVSLALGLVQSAILILRLRPAILVGFGGYAAIPATLAARFLGLKLVLHEQNAVLGRANRWLAPHARKVATAFARLTGPGQSATSKVVWTGNPVRPEISARSDRIYAEPTGKDPIHLLILGGSQGASILSDLVPEALKSLPDDLQARLHISQQCRSEDLARVTKAYADTAVTPILKSFFDDVPERLSKTHLVIARSGASTCAEVTSMGRPAILIPYPSAIDDHQRCNAQQLDEAGAAWMMPQEHLTVESLAKRIEDLIRLPASLAGAAQCARAIGKPDASERLADLISQIALNEAVPRKEASAQ